MADLVDFSITKDEDDKVKQLFWADQNFQKSYGVFEDVVTFDTTYKMNRCDGDELHNI